MGFSKFVLMKVDSKFFHIKYYCSTTLVLGEQRVYDHIHVINTKGHRKKHCIVGCYNVQLVIAVVAKISVYNVSCLVGLNSD